MAFSTPQTRSNIDLYLKYNYLQMLEEFETKCRQANSEIMDFSAKSQFLTVFFKKTCNKRQNLLLKRIPISILNNSTTI